MIADVADSARQSLLLRLLHGAFEQFGGAEPTVVAAEAGAAPLNGHGWRTTASASPLELAEAAASQLANSPVLLIPSWEKQRASLEYRRPAPGYEVTLSRIQPDHVASVLAAVLPATALKNPGVRPFREIVDAFWRPYLVIYGEGMLPNLHRTFDVAVAFWVPRSSTPGGSKPVRLFRVPRNVDEQAVAEDFRALLGSDRGATRFGYVLRRDLRPGQHLSFELHDPATKKRWKDLEVWGTTVSLGELFEFPDGGVHQVKDRDLLRDAPDGNVRILVARDLRRDGTVAGADDSSLWARVPPERQLRAGDVVLRARLPPADIGGIVLAEVTADDLPLAADIDGIITLRPREDLTGPQRLMAVLFLRSTLLRTRLAHMGFATILKPLLRDFPVPQPDAPLTTTLAGLDAARTHLEQWRTEAASLLRSVFDDENAIEARRRILESGRRLRMRVDAGALLDDFSHQVRTRYPHPIAYRWSETHVQLSNGADDLAYRSILHAAEVLLCYSALAVLALGHEADLRVGAVADIRKRLSRGGTNGPGFGDWVTILQEISNSKAFRHLPDDDPLTDFRTAFASAKATAARQRLANRRNDEAHLRVVDANDLSGAIVEAHADLVTLLEHASFLADLPLVEVTSARWDALRKTARVEYRELMGDNSLVPGKERSYGSSTLEVGSLYLATEDGCLHLLRPFLVRRRCPVCRSWETFHIDSVPSSVRVKSLERGHSADEPDLRQVLEHVGLLD